VTTTPDRFPGPQEEEELIVTPLDSDPVIGGAIRYVSGSFRAMDGDGVFNLRSGSGLSESAHEVLDQLVHEVAEDSFDEVVYGVGNRVIGYIVWETSGKLKKIREEQYIYAGNLVTSIVVTQYDAAGDLKDQFTETVAYTGNRVDSITRVVA
jgi:hypothetical protein